MKNGFIILFLIMLLFLNACAKNVQTSISQYYPECHEPLEEIKQVNSGSNVAKAAGKGAAQGAVAGIISGAVIGIVSGKPAQVLQSAITGAVAGGVAGGIYGGASNTSSEENILMAKYFEQIDGDISSLTLKEAAATVSLQCYNRQFVNLLNKIRAGEMTKKAADSHFAELETGRKEALELLGKGSETTSEQRSLFEQAVAKTNMAEEFKPEDDKGSK